MWTGQRWLAVMLVAVGGVCCAAQRPASFDCSKATYAAERLVCRDTKLAALDVEVSGLYNAVVSKGEAPGERQRQRRWIARRNACGGTRACVEAAYEARRIDLQIQTGALVAQSTREYACGDGSLPVSAAFYNNSDPQSAVVTFGNEQTVALHTPTGSGARYVAPGVSFWEHHGEALVTLRGRQMTCKQKP